MNLQFLKTKKNPLPKVKVTLGEGIAHMHITQGVIINTGEEKEVSLDAEVREMILEGKLNKV